MSICLESLGMPMLGCCSAASGAEARFIELRKQRNGFANYTDTTHDGGHHWDQYQTESGFATDHKRGLDAFFQSGYRDPFNANTYFSTSTFPAGWTGLDLNDLYSYRINWTSVTMDFTGYGITGDLIFESSAGLYDLLSPMWDAIIGLIAPMSYAGVLPGNGAGARLIMETENAVFPVRRPDPWTYACAHNPSPFGPLECEPTAGLAAGGLPPFQNSSQLAAISTIEMSAIKALYRDNPGWGRIIRTSRSTRNGPDVVYSCAGNIIPRTEFEVIPEAHDAEPWRSDADVDFLPNELPDPCAGI